MANPEPSDELQAMICIEQAVTALDDEESQARVIRWAADRFSVSLKPARRGGGGTTEDFEHDIDPDEFGSLVDFYDAAGPATEARKALVVGYWFQFKQGQEKFAAADVNKELKDLGHALSNVTVAFNRLKTSKPALALQLAKSGKSQQARKLYKISQAGKKEVEKMIAGGGSTPD